jgi:hypothetical protein
MGCSSSKESTSNSSSNKVQKAREGYGNGSVNQTQTSQNQRFAVAGPQNGGERWVSPTAGSSNISHPAGNASTFQRDAAGGSALGLWPKVIQRPNMQFTVYIHKHTISSPPLDIPCWTYISHGLSQVNQPDVVFTLLRRQNENEEQFPEAPVEWMRTVFALASGGLNLETGQMCDLVFEGNSVHIRLNQFLLPQSPHAWASMQRFGMLVHGISLSKSVFNLPDGTLPPYPHHVIALTREEAAVARQFGCTRVIGHVGLSVRWFPYPPWIDRDRKDCVVMADQSGSIRIGLPVARMYGFNAVLAGDEIVFSIPEGEEKRNLFRSYVLEAPFNAALAFESFMVDEADSGLVWKSGQSKPMGYAAVW